jgi:3-dehydroquinate synthase class II
MLVEAETPDGTKHSTLLQNAETVRLVGPAAAPPGAAQGSTDSSDAAAWQAVSVSALHVGQQVYVLQQQGARHTGISIQERISER